MWPYSYNNVACNHVQEFVIKKLTAKKKVGSGVGKAEIKMAVIVLYYIIVGLMSQITFTYFEVKAKANRDSLQELFLCESLGNPECDINLGNINALNILSIVTVILVNFLPVVVLLFSFHPKARKGRKKSLLVSMKTSTKLSLMSV